MTQSTLTLDEIGKVTPPRRRRTRSQCLYDEIVELEEQLRHLMNSIPNQVLISDPATRKELEVAAASMRNTTVALRSVEARESRRYNQLMGFNA